MVVALQGLSLGHPKKSELLGSGLRSLREQALQTRTSCRIFVSFQVTSSTFKEQSRLYKKIKLYYTIMKIVEFWWEKRQMTKEIRKHMSSWRYLLTYMARERVFSFKDAKLVFWRSCQIPEKTMQKNQRSASEHRYLKSHTLRTDFIKMVSHEFPCLKIKSGSCVLNWGLQEIICYL